MLRRTILVLTTGAALIGGLTGDALARATAHSGWDGLGDGGQPIATTPRFATKFDRTKSDPNVRPGRGGRAR
jgi:hypothetical protein